MRVDQQSEALAQQVETDRKLKTAAAQSSEAAPPTMVDTSQIGGALWDECAWDNKPAVWGP